MSLKVLGWIIKGAEYVKLNAKMAKL